MAGDNRRHYESSESHPVLGVRDRQRANRRKEKRLKQSMLATEAASASASPQRVAITSTASRNERATVTLLTVRMRK